MANNNKQKKIAAERARIQQHGKPTNTAIHYKFKVVRLEVPEPAPKTSKEKELDKHLKFFYGTLIALAIEIFGVAVSIWSPTSIWMTVFSALWLAATAWIAVIISINLMSCPQVIMKLRDEVEEERRNANLIDIADAVSTNEENIEEIQATGTNHSTRFIDLAKLPEYRKYDYDEDSDI